MVALAVAALAVSSCTGGGDEDADETPGAADAIDGFAFDPNLVDRSFQSIHRLEREDPGALREASMERLESTEPEVRFAAVYALSITVEEGPSADALADLLSSERVDERMLAAAGLLDVGRTEALPVLIAALGDDSELALRDPPKRAWELARSLLLAFTDEGLGLAEAVEFEDVAATRPDWEAWWESNGASLVFRADGHRFVGDSG